MKRLSKTIGIIGCGNMGSAILSGLLRNHIAKSDQVCVYDSILSKMAALSKKFRVRKAKSNSDLVRRVQIVLLAIKPQDLHTVAQGLRGSFRSGQFLVSILAGTPIRKLQKAFGNRPVIVRAMPNLGAQVGEGITVLTSSSRPGLNIGETIFSGCGRTINLSEGYFDLVTAVSGSGPAYFFLLMELLIQAARKGGIPEKAARLLAIQTALGAGKLAQLSPHSPGVLRKMVTSKKGTTDAALRFLSKNGFSRIFISAISRAVQRARELSRT